ncbi:hypothetical protein H7U05_30910 [Priestia megaterium]|uniref:hypothetical protein n=1 Tax=Priestia megaterium TaxID=1404 RepID=UPI001C8D5285|nr:hypothetical protein [Priestia megaterium]MBY0201610.1 hypothetical protein [Priestia megaterium]
MAKRNKNKLKKRKQRQLKKAFKHSENHSQKVELEAQQLLLQNDYLPPYREQKEDTNKKHEERNKAYQKALNKVYEGKVIHLGNYVNSKCILLHKCSECGREFYSRCGWLLTKENQKHICGVDTARSENRKTKDKQIGVAVKKEVKQLNEAERQEICELFKNGMSVYKLTKSFNLSKYMVNKYLREAGLK